MFKKIFAIATVLCVIPAMANAGLKWQLGTRAMTNGGSITSLNMTNQTVTAGAVFRAYTTASTNVTIDAATGYKILKYSVNGAITGGTITDPTQITVANPQLTGGQKVSIQAWFARNGYTVTGTYTGNGSINKSVYNNVYAGLLNPPKSFIFTPADQAVNVTSVSINGVAQTASGTQGSVVFNILDATTGLPITLPTNNNSPLPAGSSPRPIKVQVDILNVGSANVTVAGVFNGTPAATGTTSASCQACHTTQGIGTPGIFAAWSSSLHNNGFHPAECYNCHIGANTAAHPGADPKTACQTCHTGSHGYADGSGVLSTEVNACVGCHAAGATGIHSVTTPTEESCIACHDVAIKHVGADGVRAIVPEFSRNSHHISTGDIKNAQCVMCHLEGKNVGGAIVIDTTKHLNGNGVIDLRSGNSAITADVQWDPASPDHTAMDNFCMSCHNASGAVTSFVNVSSALRSAGLTASATNPFGTNMTNGYDTLQRPVVTPVYEQFDTSNAAHHAVRGAKYTVRTRTGAFSNNSSAALPGVRKTIYDAGLFVSTYTPLGDTLSVADNSVLHCGDCHTVGQVTGSGAVNAAGAGNLPNIGAHGSINEYMLRTSTGVDALHHQSNNTTGGAPDPEDGTYVCFLCHVQTEEETGGYNAMGFHGGIEGSSSSYCNGRAAESVGLTGFGGTFKNTYGSNGVKTGQTRVPNIIGTNAGGNVFGYSCAHCHNAGQNNTFGGIHGGNTAYKTYSGVGTTFTIVQRKPYRFLGGLSLRYNGAADDSTRWENSAKFDKSRREGCYNQSTVAMTTPAKLWGPGARTDTNAVADDIPAQPNGSNGTWGSCSHHSGTTTAGSGTQPTRIGVIRPLNY